MPREIGIDALHTLLTEDNPRRIIVDVRMPFEVAGGMIAGAVNIPLDEIVSAKDRLATYDEVYLVCQSGGRSMLAQVQLEMAGLTSVSNVVGGMRLWREKGYPIEVSK
jgi:rhodanese-related sulfurtransferase